MTRQRSAEAHQRVIAAAIALFGERGIDAVSMDAIARAASVSKATIYNHWADKEALLLEVMLHVNGLNSEPEDVNTGLIETDLAMVLSRRPPGEFEEMRRKLTPSLIAYSAVHPDFGAAWRNSVMEPPRRCLRRVLVRGIERGMFPPDLDMEVSLALLLGPMLYRHIFNATPEQAQRNIGAEVARAFCHAFSVWAHGGTRRSV